MPKTKLLAIDQGTTSTRAILFDDQARPLRSHAVPLRQIYPANGWVEHDPREIWQAALECCRAVLKGEGADSVAAIGITNQRETSLIWNRKTGKIGKGTEHSVPSFPIFLFKNPRGARESATAIQQCKMRKKPASHRVYGGHLLSLHR